MCCHQPSHVCETRSLRGFDDGVSESSRATINFAFIDDWDHVTTVRAPKARHVRQCTRPMNHARHIAALARCCPYWLRRGPAPSNRKMIVDHYRRLQVTRDADPAVIERAYKALSQKHHPDLSPASQRAVATRRMQELNEAYRVLRSPDLRRSYDASLPSDGASGWDQFWEKGLVGLFNDRFTRQPRR